MEKVNSHSMDSIDENIEKIKKIFPEVIENEKIDFEKLKNLLGEYNLAKDEKYSFDWSGKEQSSILADTVSTGTLLACKEKGVEFDKTNNIYIEGDNLEVLKILKKAYNKKIKMIYIDPPYNIKADTVYEDDYSDNLKNYIEKSGQNMKANPETDGKKHTKWLNMIYPRLRVAKNLLTEDGVIFISIDEYEVANLRKICDDVFGAANFVIEIAINRPSESATGTCVFKHEYMVVYCRNINEFKVSGAKKETISRGTVGNDNQTMPEIIFPKGLKCYNMKDGVYKETRKIIGSSENVENFNPIVIENGVLKNDIKLKARWRSSKDMRKFFDNNCQRTPAKINGDIIEIYFENDRFNPQIRKSTFEKIPSLYLNNKKGSDDLNKLNLNGLFEYPKCVDMLKYFINIITKKDDIVMDFFSGSASFGEAVMSLNEDGKNRKFILVQLPELYKEKHPAYKEGYKNICELAEERLRRASDYIKKYNKKNTSDLGFKVFKLESSNLKIWNSDELNIDNANEYFYEHMDPFVEGRTNDDLLYEILLKEGIQLSVKIEEKIINNSSIYSIDNGNLIICLEDNITVDLVKEIGKQNPESVIFKDNGFADENSKANSIQELKKYGINELKIKSI